jgi:putative copper resistance protein D
LNDPLIVVRATHFAATALTAGVLAFLVLVASPALRAAPADGIERRLLRIAWIGLAATLASGLAWVALEIGAMSGLPLAEAVREGMVPVVLTQTQFGIVANLRLALAALLAASLGFAAANEDARRLSLACAAAMLGALAWTGHAAGTVGARGTLHAIGDALHVLAAGAWVGGLLPLALLLSAARRHHDHRWASAAYVATRRFSALGMASVATLIATGALNAWILVGSFAALVGTEYGRLLLLKLALFVAMLCLAGLNRLYWTPRLAPDAPGSVRARALFRLSLNSSVEAGLGLGIFVVVGVLGTLHPAIHLVPP